MVHNRSPLHKQTYLSHLPKVSILSMKWPKRTVPPVKTDLETAFSWDVIVECIVLLQDEVRKGLCAISSSPCFNGTNTHLSRIRDFVANTPFLVLLLLRFYSDICTKEWRV